MDAARIGGIASDVWKQVTSDFTDEANVRTIGVIVEIDGKENTHILVACSDDRPWAQAAFFQEAVFVLEDQMRKMLEDREDD